MRLKVVYIDDEEYLLENFRELFANDQVDIATFTDPARACVAIASDPPDLVVVDNRLGTTTGPELAARLAPAIPKVLLTGDLIHARDPQFTRVFDKPMNYEEIQNFLRDCLARKRTTGAG